jgi:predicted nucleic acid-binding protein
VTVFVDTSALLAFLDADQSRHADTVEAWRQAIDGRDRLVTSNYVLVEVVALVQRQTELLEQQTRLLQSLVASQGAEGAEECH